MATINSSESLIMRAQQLGIQPTWTDIWGNEHTASEAVCQILVQAIEASEKSTQTPFVLEPVMVIKEDENCPSIAIKLPSDQEEGHFFWQLHLENGHHAEGHFFLHELLKTGDVELGTTAKKSFSTYSFTLPQALPQGYHCFVLQGLEGQSDSSCDMQIIVTPDRCYLPHLLERNDHAVRKVWGPTVQVYALKSDKNWGIGDFGDLNRLVDWCSDQKAAILGLSPLHALFPHNPELASPYSPSSRLFLNTLLLDIEGMDDFIESEEAHQLVYSPNYQEALLRLRHAASIDYKEVASLKSQVLELLFKNFLARHHSKSSSQEPSEKFRAFEHFVEKQGERLKKFALYQALQEHFYNENPEITGWQAWPEAYQDPQAEAVKEFFSRNAERIEYYQYLQWQTDSQLQRVGKKCFEKNMGIGLFMDLAVGLDPMGADVWMNQDLYALDIAIGAPPDICNSLGQNWGFAAVLPQKLREEGYCTFIQMLRQNMAHCGALSLDHVMSLMRLFWIPGAVDSVEGTYVHYPCEELFGILALESQRNSCMVIGEDMGTVPDAMRECMDRWGVYSNKAFFFEKDETGHFLPPESYPSTCAISLSTHDLPTLSGFWQGQDLTLRTDLNLYPSREFAETDVKERVVDRVAMLNLLEQGNLLPAGMSIDPQGIPTLTPELSTAIHSLISKSEAKILLLRFEDILAQVEQVNLPGTTQDIYPSWRLRLPLPLESIFSDERVASVMEAIWQDRAVYYPVFPVPELSQNVHKTLLPRATYRFQFHKGFTLQDAIRLVPYLKRLGISHCYASPLLKARPGSNHGYDVVDHHHLNPEVGTPQDFEQFAQLLKSHDMALLLDIVPNHMAVDQENSWWIDVLENGPGSNYSDYFDINWHPLAADLQNKILLPILGDTYGKVLSNGDLKLRFDFATSRLWLDYYENSVPINPRSYTIVLRHRLEVLEARLGKSTRLLEEYQSIMFSLENLPQALDGDSAEKEIRVRERRVCLQRLNDLIHQSEEIRNFLQESLIDFQSEAADPTNLLRLNRLLEQQSYRLSNWRVASDEINYRRFFDVDALIGLRVEDKRVFNDSHSLIMDWVEQGYVHGLRIDHPDGLHDPTLYFQNLQEEAAKRLQLPQANTENWFLSSKELPLYVSVEKILAPFERIPTDWAVHGTTGYDFIGALNGVFVCQENEIPFNRIYEDFIDGDPNFTEMVYSAKKLVMKTMLNGELGELSTELGRLCKYNWSTRDFTINNLRMALMEVIACFPVYRTYIRPGNEINKKDCDYIAWAVGVAKRRNPVTDPSIFEFIQSTLLLTFSPEGYSLENPSNLETALESFQSDLHTFVLKFQQYSGPVMAKGLEDTSFYRYHRLISLNEVGGEPQQFGVPVASFHYQNQERLKRMPDTLLSSSTHDTKRSEDTRARINVLSEMPDEWRRHVRRWRQLNKRHRVQLDEQMIAPSSNTEYLFYQTLIGMWPLGEVNDADRAVLSERLENYMIKAEREAKNHTSWINPNLQYEDALKSFVKQVVTVPNPSFTKDFESLHFETSWFGIFNALSQTVLKMTSPGVPDFYQGSELLDFSLVDPDNRRPVDYALREQYFAELDHVGEQSQVELVQNPQDGRLKLYLIRSVLALRSQHSELFQEGIYTPLEVKGVKAEHVITFLRQWKEQFVIVVVPRLLYRMGLRAQHSPCGNDVWKNTEIVLPHAFNVKTAKNSLDHQTVDTTEPILVGNLLQKFPVAIIEGEISQ